MNKRRYSLKRQAFIEILISAFIAIGAYFLLDAVVTYALDYYLGSAEHIYEKNDQSMNQFEEFVFVNEIAAVDTEQIDNWVKRKRTAYIIMDITRDSKILYDSIMYGWEEDISFQNEEQESIQDYSESDELEITDSDYAAEETGIINSYSQNEWFLTRDIEFADGKAEVSLYGYFDDQLYIYAIIGQIMLSVLIFAGIFVFLNRRKINYIVQLEQEIKILETGGLENEITIKGTDELAALAEGLNQMRLALLENMKKEEEAVKANYDLVVAISHDLRTPLTTLSLYLDLLHKEKNMDIEQFQAYLEKSRGKVVQIKRMSDQLFERFFLSKNDHVVLEEPKKVKVIFEDYLSGMASYLDINGFKLESNISWIDVKTSVATDYIGRIFDNISTNIIKYADRAEAVELKVGEENGEFSVQFSNKIMHYEEKMERTEIGVRNIKIMMANMGGLCVAHQSEDDYTIKLLFKII